MLEVRASNLLLKFPDELDVDRWSLLQSVTGTKQRRQSGTLVIGRAAADVSIAFFVKDERGSLPLRLVRRLDIQVVVNCDGRSILPRNEFSYDDRIARCGDHLRFGTERSKILRCG